MRPLGLLASMSVGLVSWAYACSGGDLIAFSLREAQRQAATGRKSESLASVGGITRVVGTVHDVEGGDIILVGRVMRGLPAARLDDLVVALRARIVHDNWPRVSIEPTPETLKTRRQTVLFSKGIAGTPLGQNIVDCDIILKRYSLELAPTAKEVKSYRFLCAEHIRRRTEAAGGRLVRVQWLEAKDGAVVCGRRHGRPIRQEECCQIRFWFFPREPYHFAAPEGVFIIRELQLPVKVEQLTSAGGSPQPAGRSCDFVEAGRAFARQFSAGLHAAGTVHPLLSRLKVLYDLIAVADGIRTLKRPPNLDYFLKVHPVAPVKTPCDYELLDLYGFLKQDDGTEQAVRISGGVELRTAVKWLNDGDVTQLLEVVVRSRPSPQALCWSPPLAGWDVPNAQDLDVSPEAVGAPPGADAVGRSGCYFAVQSCVLGGGGALGGPDTRRFAGFGPPPPPPGGGLAPAARELALKQANAALRSALGGAEFRGA